MKRLLFLALAPMVSVAQLEPFVQPVDHGDHIRYSVLFEPEGLYKTNEFSLSPTNQISAIVGDVTMSDVLTTNGLVTSRKWSEGKVDIIASELVKLQAKVDIIADKLADCLRAAEHQKPKVEKFDGSLPLTPFGVLCIAVFVFIAAAIFLFPYRERK